MLFVVMIISHAQSLDGLEQREKEEEANDLLSDTASVIENLRKGLKSRACTIPEQRNSVEAVLFELQGRCALLQKEKPSVVRGILELALEAHKKNKNSKGEATLYSMIARQLLAEGDRQNAIRSFEQAAIKNKSIGLSFYSCFAYYEAALVDENNKDYVNYLRRADAIKKELDPAVLESHKKQMDDITNRLASVSLTKR